MESHFLKQNSVRFTRWSRKPYAIFLSLKVCVTIGRLRKSVADSSLCKTGKLGLFLYCTRKTPMCPFMEEERNSGPPLPFPMQKAFCTSSFLLPISQKVITFAEVGQGIFMLIVESKSIFRKGTNGSVPPFRSFLVYTLNIICV